MFIGASRAERDHSRERVSIPAELTELQGQYLAFIHAYTKIHRRPPAEADLQRYFAVTPPSVHRMVVELEHRGFIRRQPRQARSIEILIAPEHLPALK
jgi:DNA-binding MarR family transcriptional regulator